MAIFRNSQKLAKEERSYKQDITLTQKGKYFIIERKDEPWNSSGSSSKLGWSATKRKTEKMMMIKVEKAPGGIGVL